jgi:hypothetical protein
MPGAHWRNGIRHGLAQRLVVFDHPLVETDHTCHDRALVVAAIDSRDAKW